MSAVLRSAGLAPRIAHRLVLQLGALAAAVVMGSPAQAQNTSGSEPNAGGIYTCIDDKGRKITSDRPIPDCMSREQRVLNRDGSLRGIKPPQMTADERAEREAAERKVAAEKATQNDAIRRDRNLISRYPNEASHRKSREDALNTVRAAIKATEMRVVELAAERQPLESEAEFYKGKTLPLKLKQQLDANDAAVEAQKSSAQNQTVELGRINGLYDVELERLRRLWAGAAPGSLGPALVAAAAVPAAVPVAVPAAVPVKPATPAAAGAAPKPLKPAAASASR